MRKVLEERKIKTIENFIMTTISSPASRNAHSSISCVGLHKNFIGTNTIHLHLTIWFIGIWMQTPRTPLFSSESLNTKLFRYLIFKVETENRLNVINKYFKL